MLPNIHVYDEFGELLFLSLVTVAEQPRDINQPGRWTARCMIPGGLLNVGTFNVSVVLTVLSPAVHVAFLEVNALAFQVCETLDEAAERRRGGWMGSWPGPLRPRCEWTVNVSSQVAGV